MSTQLNCSADGKRQTASEVPLAESRIPLADTRTVYSLTPFTQLDYPDHMACIVWLAGCNMRCSYCYNPEIIYGQGEKDWSEVKSFLKKRQGLLDAVVFSGGECTLHPHLEFFCQESKKLGYKVKIDTNGSQPEIVESLLDKGLIDMISLDFKAPKKKFQKISVSNHYQKLIKTLKLLIAQDQLKFEVRTTVHTELLQEDDINEISLLLKELGYQGTYYLQNYLDVEETVGQLSSQDFPLNHQKLQAHVPLSFRNFLT